MLTEFVIVCYNKSMIMDYCLFLVDEKDQSSKGLWLLSELWKIRRREGGKVSPRN